MGKLIATTNILCTDVPNHPRHQIQLFDDGTVTCGCGDSGLVEARRLGAAVTLGVANVLRRSCAGFVAFVSVGLPRLVAARIDATGAWGGWKTAWDAYSTNALVREAYRDLLHKRDAEFAETLKVAYRALSSCPRYRNGMSRGEFRDEVTFVPNGEIKVGASIALFASDGWTVPLQKGWIESVGKAKPVIDGRFLVGVNEKQPGFVYAIDGSDEAGFEIREFAVVGHRLGKVAVGA
jgi:hypothetical protein